jgi:hypothetical protein
VKRLSEEHKRHISEAHKGLKHSEETLLKLSLAKKGKPCDWIKTKFKKGQPAWNKSYINPIRILIRGSIPFQQWRTSVFKRDKFACFNCGKKGYLHAHHKKSFYLILKEFLKKYSQFSPVEDKEILVRLTESYEPFWDINNGQTLCKECHKRTNNYTQKAKAENQ